MTIRDETTDAFWRSTLRSRGMSAEEVVAEMERLDKLKEQTQQERDKLVELLSVVVQPEQLAELLRQSGIEAAEVDRLMTELGTKAKQLAPEPKRPS